MRTTLKKLAILVLGALALAVPLTVAWPAAADDWERANHKGRPSDGSHKYYCVRAEDSRAYACVMPYDERFYVWDWDDTVGNYAVMEWKSSTGRSGFVTNKRNAWYWRDKSFAESTKITFRICVSVPGGARQYCSGWRTVRAG